MLAGLIVIGGWLLGAVVCASTDCFAWMLLIGAGSIWLSLMVGACKTNCPTVIRPTTPEEDETLFRLMLLDAAWSRGDTNITINNEVPAQPTVSNNDTTITGDIAGAVNDVGALGGKLVEGLAGMW